jgi:L-fucose isomerase-like protein
MLKPRVGLYAVYEPPEEGWQDWEGKLRQVSADLQVEGLEVLQAPEAVKDLASCERVAGWLSAQRLDVLHALVITWSFDHYTVEIQQRVFLPVAIRSLPGIRTGSLVGGQQLQCLLADLGVEHRLFFGPPGSAQVAEQTAIYARACALVRHLRGARMAVIGRRTEGMTPTAVDEVEILRLFGTRLLNYGLDEFEVLARQVSMAEAEFAWDQIASNARAVTSKREHGINTARNYLALKGMVRQLSLQAVSIGSYPQCQGSMCVPIALLNQDGIATGCEGDVNSTLALFLLTLLSDSPARFGEMLDVDVQANTVVSSHCGCGSPALADQEGYILCPVRLANDGVCIRYAAQPGPITFVNLVGRRGNYRLCAIEGEAIPTGLVFEGTPLKFKMRSPFEKVWKAITGGGFGHHWMTGYGHFVPELAEFCRLTGVRGAFPDIE